MRRSFGLSDRCYRHSQPPCRSRPNPETRSKPGSRTQQLPRHLNCDFLFVGRTREANGHPATTGTFQAAQLVASAFAATGRMLKAFRGGVRASPSREGPVIESERPPHPWPWTLSHRVQITPDFAPSRVSRARDNRVDGDRAHQPDVSSRGNCPTGPLASCSRVGRGGRAPTSALHPPRPRHRSSGTARWRGQGVRDSVGGLRPDRTVMSIPFPRIAGDGPMA
jgi:hypothetical protein